jgi:hypothetical protein
VPLPKLSQLETAAGLGSSLALAKGMRTLLVLFIAGILSAFQAQAGMRCEALFPSGNGAETAAQEWIELYKKSDTMPRQQLWTKIRQSLEKNVTHLSHPLELAGQNPDKIGLVIKSMSEELPILRTLINADQQPRMKYKDYIMLKRTAANQIIQVTRNSRSSLQVFAALEALKYLAAIESRVDFPKTQEQIEQEKKEAGEEKKKEEKKQEKKQEKKEQQKKDPKSDEKEDEEEPEWNNAKEKYKPENKDLSKDDSGGKKKNVPLVITDAPVKNMLLRQRIYDEYSYDQLEWSSLPVMREPVLHENKFSHSLVLNPLKSQEVTVPLPYGYTLIPGKYADHQVIEVGPGEFTMRTSSEKPVTLGIAKITQESVTPRPIRPVEQSILNHWPKALLNFTLSLRGLPPLEAARKLEKYISLEGGFLYYSKGDKIDAAELAKIDAKMKEALRTMPKPMAMAHAEAFNCDGAAWIGALLLRDVLHIPTRIAGGRTLGGFDQVNGKKVWVSMSSSDAHAWLEVYDPQKKAYVPFDMTPKNNVPDRPASESDLKQDLQQEQKPEDPPSADKKEQKKADAKDKKESKDGKEDKKESKEGQEAKDQKDGKEGKEEGKKESEEGKGDQKIEDLIQAKSTERKKGESQQTLIDRILKRNELMFLEQLIHEGPQSKYVTTAGEVIKTIGSYPIWRNQAARSEGNLSTMLNEARFAKYPGLQNLVNKARVDFSKNNAKEAHQSLRFAERMLLTLAGYRNLNPAERDSLSAITRINTELNAIKHKNSKELAVVEEVLRNLPGGISKEWLKTQYGNDYAKLGSAANVHMAQDLVSGKLKSLLEVAASREFVDMNLNSVPDPRFKDEATFYRSIIPKPQRDLVVTRNPMDFANFLWDLRPGEHRFAATLQGRQFAIGSLETERIPDPKTPVEKKISMVYYDMSKSMEGKPAEAQDAILMAFVDKALSEVDAIGRPIHEIYLIPFTETVGEKVHISSREDAIAYLSKRMVHKSIPDGGTQIQPVILDFYNTIGASYKNKSALGRNQLFQKANFVLISDGGSTLDLPALREARKQIPDRVKISMNFNSLGDEINQNLKALIDDSSLSSGKPNFRLITAKMIKELTDIHLEFDPDAFATTEKINGALLARINDLLTKVGVDTRQAADKNIINQSLGKIQITKTEMEKLPGLREMLDLTKFKELIVQLKMDRASKERLVEGIVLIYPQVVGRPWKEMTFQEQQDLTELYNWAKK